MFFSYHISCNCFPFIIIGGMITGNEVFLVFYGRFTMSIQLRENILSARKLPRTDSVLMGRAEFLAPEDRDLIEAVLIRCQPAESIGRMLKVRPRIIRKRVHRLGRRIASRKFLNAVRALPFLSDEDAELAKLYYCRSLSQRRLCDDLELTTHALRRRLDRLSAKIDMITRIRKAGAMADAKLAVAS